MDNDDKSCGEVYSTCGTNAETRYEIDRRDSVVAVDSGEQKILTWWLIWVGVLEDQYRYLTTRKIGERDYAHECD